MPLAEHEQVYMVGIDVRIAKEESQALRHKSEILSQQIDQQCVEHDVTRQPNAKVYGAHVDCTVQLVTIVHM